MIGLTKRQREILDFIESYAAQKRCSPSYRDIQDFFGFSSIGTVFNHIQTLKRKGVLCESSKGARSLAIQTEKMVPRLPLIGTLKGGFPIETFAQSIMVPFPSLPEEAGYVLTIEGDHLIEECLLPEDLVLVSPRAAFEDGEMVIALIEKQTTLVKRAFYDPPYIRLESTNPHVNSLILREDHIEIQGIILSVMRNFAIPLHGHDRTLHE